MSEHDTIWIEPKKLLVFIMAMVTILALSWSYWLGYRNGVNDGCSKVCADPTQTSAVIVTLP
jgi:zona occludens toxin (predicted ATPase)